MSDVFKQLLTCRGKLVGLTESGQAQVLTKDGWKQVTSSHDIMTDRGVKAPRDVDWRRLAELKMVIRVLDDEWFRNNVPPRIIDQLQQVLDLMKKEGHPISLSRVYEIWPVNSGHRWRMLKSEANEFLFDYGFRLESPKSTKALEHKEAWVAVRSKKKVEVATPAS